MSLELLSNELLLYVFEFLDDVQLFHAFYGLNHQFNALLFNDNHIHCLDFRSILKRDFQTICEKYVPAAVDRITSICFSDDHNTPQQIRHYLDHSMPLRLFSNLRSLSLYHICSYKIIKEISDEWRFLLHLTQLCFTDCHIKPATYTNRSSFHKCQSLVDRIWCLPKLIRCHFGSSFPGNNVFQVPTVTSMSLKHLSVEHLYFRFSQLAQLIERTPSIRHLCISINLSFVDIDLLLTIPSITSLVLHVRDAPLAIRKLLKCMPGLIHLTVKFTDTYLGYTKNWVKGTFSEDLSYESNLHRISTSPSIYMNGYRWETITINYLPKLKTFQLKMDIQYWSLCNKEEEVDKLLMSFSSHFWIRERRWFVRCDWNSINVGYLINGFEYFFPGFAYKLVPTKLTLVPSRTR